ncbi:nitronate monooxygenase [Palleronia salina]|uniref:Nitronate monooxygenase n=1 Tax=Palleronia salina TaxID=313368 RepID=A0A1M6I5L9_9RHOB|nr:nitronate monooxygenase [Palleronia salina]
MIRSRLSDLFGLDAPVVLAPMAGVSGGALAAAVSRAGGLGLVGGGYGDPDVVAREMALADAPVGVGFITWSLTPETLDRALDLRPRALLLSFGDPVPFADAIHAADVPLICQVQGVAHARRAIAAGAAVLVAQGGEAGGHGAARGTMALVPEIADLLAAEAPDVVLVAAGGIADGRGMAAALMLGADGVMLGSRFWAASEALVAPGLVDAALAADGDCTVKGDLPDAARGLNWPGAYAIRTLRTAFTDRWDGRGAALRDDADARAGWVRAMQSGDAEAASPVVGEAVGLIGDRLPAADILARVVAEAEDLLRDAPRRSETCSAPS